ncbi:terminase large subunit domain-containing protein [Roseicitreum antarcticum]|uniref:Phage terminase-like protein, large subunit, contains N-terminal HTH domain n=1 Tax=Roseicitreum antarcticum TaxID=564137 RepID=A0A1H2WBU3_9RHOB|nr:terminase large subunit [Roseicitreum antarcticum]SDW77956.1 Phage terminase-like protein, large subunit, contains N-terminal HTH domain [Roseicitreum antarcticum]
MLATEPLPRFACPDWWDRIHAGHTPMADVPVNEARAAKALAFFKRLQLPDVPGNPTMEEACGEWFLDILMVFLASEDPETKERLVWELLCMVPKKNSKSTYVAGLALTALYMEETPNGQMLLIGPSQNISERCFEQAVGMIRLNEKLAAIFKVQESEKEITRYKTKTTLSVKTFGSKILTGEIPLLTIIDELHELGRVNGAARVMQQIRGGGITPQGGQVLFITTQSDQAPTGVWKTELDKARDIRDGKAGRSPIMLPVLYEFPTALQKDQKFWRNAKNWPLVLPNLGRSINNQRLLDDYENNGKITPEAEQIWVSQHLNIQIGLGLSGETWIGAQYWEACADEQVTLDYILRVCDVVTIGIDGGGLDDLLGAAVIGRHAQTRQWLIWTRAWAAPIVLQRRKDIAENLRDFEREGDLVICDRPGQGHAELAELVQQVMQSGLLPEEAGVGLDHGQVAPVLEALADLGIEGPLLVGIRQGGGLRGPIWNMELKLQAKQVSHAGAAMMDWVVGNAKATRVGSMVTIEKVQQGTAKIDPLIATFNAAELMGRNPVAFKPVDYDAYLKAAVLVA